MKWPAHKVCRSHKKHNIMMSVIDRRQQKWCQSHCHQLSRHQPQQKQLIHHLHKMAPKIESKSRTFLAEETKTRHWHRNWIYGHWWNDELKKPTSSLFKSSDVAVRSVNVNSVLALICAHKSEAKLLQSRPEIISGRCWKTTLPKMGESIGASSRGCANRNPLKCQRRST